MRSAAALAASVLLAGMFACGSIEDFGREVRQPDVVPDYPPTVVSTTPASDAVDVAVDSTLSVTFNAPVDAATVNSSTVSLVRTGGGPVAVTVSCVASVATITPTAPLVPVATYTVRVETGVRGLTGKPLAAAYSWTFSTRHWAPTSTTGAPTARKNHTAIWTGQEMIVWGGIPSTQAGGRYNPLTDSWLPTKVEGAPAPRSGHTAVWTGKEMIVWGGTAGANGGRYDPATDTWKAIGTVGAPNSSDGHVAVAADGDMIVWGGATQAPIGATYHPATDTWTPMKDFTTRTHTVAVWTGSKMILWGGCSISTCTGEGGCIIQTDTSLGTGATYDPKADTWTPISSTLAPMPRCGHVADWAGDRMFVWGGGSANLSSSPRSSGGAYVPAQDAWIPMAAAGAPTGGTNALLAWTGTRLLVFSADLPTQGAYYDPLTDGWSPMPSAGAPSTRTGSASVWTGTAFVVWGGEGQATGGRFVP